MVIFRIQVCHCTMVKMPDYPRKQVSNLVWQQDWAWRWSSPESRSTPAHLKKSWTQRPGEMTVRMGMMIMMPVLLTKVCGPDPESLEVSELLHAGAGRGAGALVGHLQGQLAALEAATCRPADYSCYSCDSCYSAVSWYCHLVSG